MAYRVPCARAGTKNTFAPTNKTTEFEVEIKRTFYDDYKACSH